MNPRLWREALLLLAALGFPIGQSLLPMLLLAVVLVVELIAHEPLWRRTPLDRSLALLIVAVLASSLNSPWRAIALTSTAEFAAGAFVVIRAVTLACERPAFARRFLTALAAGGALAGLLGTLSTRFTGDGRAALPHHGPSLLGGTLAVTGVVLLGLLLIEPSRRRRYLAGTLCAALGLGLTWSRGAWLAAVAGVAALGWLVGARRQMLVAVASAGMLVAAALVSSPQWALLGRRASEVVDPRSPLSRVNLWRTGVAIAAAHPVLGTGFTTFSRVYPRFARPAHPEPIPHAHNILLTFAAETGLVGLAAFVLFIGVGVRTAVEQYARAAGEARTVAAVVVAALAALLAHQMVDVTLLNSSVAFGLYALFALGASGHGQQGEGGG